MPLSTTEPASSDVVVYPSPKELLPQGGRMNWLERVDAHTSGRTVCSVRVPADTPLSAADGSLPGFAAIEFMAQAAAAHALLELRAAAKAAPSGAATSPGRILLLGSREIEFSRERYAAGECLEVETQVSSFSRSGLAVLACCVRDPSGCELARARLNLLAQE